MSQEVFDKVVEHLREISLLESTQALLEWDERTGLPSQAIEFRAQQATLLSGMIHRRKTDPQLGEWLQQLSESDLVADPESCEGATVLRLQKDYERNTKLPTDLVEAISTATVLGQQAWDSARKAADWNAFKPHMEKIFGLRKQEAELLQTDGQTLYDAMLDQYEEGARASELSAIFGELRDGLVDLVQTLRGAPNAPSGLSWQREVSKERQRQVCYWVSEAVGFSFERGRLDETSHPFCTTLGPNDCRILTRYHERNFATAFYGTLHEAGHGLYEQGLVGEWYGLPPGRYASLGVHESQSRLWENFVGRSEAFWQWGYSKVADIVGSSWGDLSPEQVYRDANRVEPSLIRVEADEVTYNLHILIRFEIEQLLMSGELEIADAPDAWNSKYEHYLGIQPPSVADGILQDVHWSAGLVGYFPTYTLGNVYAAQLMEAAEQELGDLNAQFAQGEFTPLLQWLRSKIHAHGFRLHPGELIRRATGQSLDSKPLLAYLRGKLAPVYGIDS
ncbi:MAG: carboxypeptidase M32 [Pirellulaceae bacterium]